MRPACPKCKRNAAQIRRTRDNKLIWFCVRCPWREDDVLKKPKSKRKIPARKFRDEREI